MRSVLALVAMAAVAAAAPVVQWTRVGRAAPTETVEFSVALKEKNLDVLENVREAGRVVARRCSRELGEWRRQGTGGGGWEAVGGCADPGCGV
jgi:hypothetical protein